ncbi:unnamed protein product [Ilex paraguariensis]|uniref:Uncharacterized protein n=1 Tax=Ilex paraguariensis TaxID=185542 RepID=A0ABC8QP24_9AQUA
MTWLGHSSGRASPSANFRPGCVQHGLPQTMDSPSSQVEMYRSSSTTARFSDEFLVNLLPGTNGSPSPKPPVSDDLPTYDPISDATKKEISSNHKSLGQNVIHLIPLVLILCALILWLSSNPATM